MRDPVRIEDEPRHLACAVCRPGLPPQPPQRVQTAPLETPLLTSPVHFQPAPQSSGSPALTGGRHAFVQYRPDRKHSSSGAHGPEQEKDVVPASHSQESPNAPRAAPGVFCPPLDVPWSAGCPPEPELWEEGPGVGSPLDEQQAKSNAKIGRSTKRERTFIQGLG